MAQLLVSHYPSIDALASASAEELETIEGMGPITAHRVSEWFQRPRHREIVNKLRRAGTRLQGVRSQEIESKDARGEQPLAELTFVITGTLATQSRREAKALIEAHGGKVTGSVSGKTSYLLAGESPGSKLRKAERLGIPVINEAALQNMIEGESF